METIDTRVLGELRSLDAGASGFLNALIDLFLREGKSQMTRLRQALENQDVPRFERAAHVLKGSSGHLGALRMSRICNELQSVARGADWGRANELLPELEEEFRGVCQKLSQEKAKD